jgi:hypothetical protein
MKMFLNLTKISQDSGQNVIGTYAKTGLFFTKIQQYFAYDFSKSDHGSSTTLCVK